jgi:hypothetical protein
MAASMAHPSCTFGAALPREEVAMLFYQGLATAIMPRVGQDHIYTVYIRYLWQENCRIYGHIRCMYTVLANPSYA